MQVKAQNYFMIITFAAANIIYLSYAILILIIRFIYSTHFYRISFRNMQGLLMSFISTVLFHFSCRKSVIISTEQTSLISSAEECKRCIPKHYRSFLFKQFIKFMLSKEGDKKQWWRIIVVKERSTKFC